LPQLISKVCSQNAIPCQVISSNTFFDHHFSVYLEANRSRLSYAGADISTTSDLCWVCAYPGEYEATETEDYLATEKNAQVIAFLGSFSNHINQPDFACPAWSSHSLSQVNWCCSHIKELHAPPVVISKNIRPGWAAWPWFEGEQGSGLPLLQYQLDNPSSPMLVICIGAGHLALELETRRQLAVPTAFNNMLAEISALLQCAYFEIVVAQDRGAWFLFDLRIFPHYINTVSDTDVIRHLLTDLILQRV
jgi:hypothetical protein